MSTKNKPVPYIDTQIVSDSPSPVTRKVRFNPYTGGIISNASDKPTFGKYTMEIRSGTKYVAKSVKFKAVNGTSVTMQIPIPEVKLFVKNPNYDILDSIVYLALDEGALADADNGGNFDQVTKQAKPADFYISFSPEKSTAVIKSTLTLTLYDQIVSLFEKYTIYQFLELLTGKPYTEITNANILMQLVQDNFINLNLYAEAGFNNDSDSTEDGYFIRNKLVTRFTFDKSYLDNPKLKSFVLRTDSTNIYIDLQCESLQSITFDLYAGPDTSFNYVTKAEFIKTYTIDLDNKTNPKLTIPVTDLGSPLFNYLDNFKTNAELTNLIFGRKSIGVKITKVKVSTGLDVLEANFADRFEINPDIATTKTTTFTTNIPTPTLSTFVGAGVPAKPPYFLDLNTNRRKFYVRIEQPGNDGFDEKNPKDIVGFLIRYTDNPATASNAIRFYKLNNSNVSLMRDGYIVSGTSTVHYYYEILDSFKYSGLFDPSFELDIPYAPRIDIYLVDKYYNVSTTPLTLNPVEQYNMSSYFATPTSTAFLMQASFMLATTNNFLPFNNRFTLEFAAEYASIVKKSNVVQPAPPLASNLWKQVNPGITYRYIYNHAWGSIIDGGSNTPVLINTATGTAVAGVDCANIFRPASYGQGYWIRLRLIEKYPTTKTLPYVNTILAIYTKYK
jgi:hypothetical protein